VSPEAYREMADTEGTHWWFCGRRSILANVIATFDLPVKARILEIGSGTGGNLQMLSSFGQVSAVEMDPTARSIALERTGGRFDIRLGSCPANIPFRNEKFDLICLFDVLEHIDQDVETLVAVKALLREGGRVLVTVPAHRWLWSGHDEFLHHKRRYTSLELREKVTTSGLRLVRISYFNMFLFPLAAFIRLRDKVRRRSSGSGTRVPPRAINRVFTDLFRSERFLLEQFNLPFGVSLLGVLQSEPQ
jgi:SAM-dependent methyltransferase